MQAHLLPDTEFSKLIGLVVSQREADIKSAVAALHEENKSLREEVAKLRGGSCWSDAGAYGGGDVGQLPMARAELCSLHAQPTRHSSPGALDYDNISPPPGAPPKVRWYEEEEDEPRTTAGPEDALAGALPGMPRRSPKSPPVSPNKGSGEGGGRGADHDIVQEVDTSIDGQQFSTRPDSLSAVAPVSPIIRPSLKLERDSTGPMGGVGGDDMIRTGGPKRLHPILISELSTRTSWQESAVTPYSDSTGCNASPPEEARPNGQKTNISQRDLSGGGSEGSQARLRSAMTVPEKLFEDSSKLVTRLSQGDETKWHPQTEYSMTFLVLATVIIWVDAACIGYQVDEFLKLGYEQHTSNDASLRVARPEHWQAVEVCFVSYYTFEIVVRGLKERTAFLFGRERFWNFFDSFSVLSSIVCLAAAKDSRFLRLVRITKALRVLRVLRFSGSLRAMVLSILSSLVPLFWLLCVMFLVIYFFTVVIITEIAELFERTSVSNDSGPDVSAFLPYYESLPGTMLYFFMSITGGIDWETMAAPLLEVDLVLVLVFVMYIFFLTFGVLNVVIGIFVDRAKQNADRDRELLTEEGLKHERQALKRMRDIFHEADINGDETLSWEEFSEYLADDEVAPFFTSLGLDVNVARALFVLLDVDDSNAVNIDEFVHGCNRLKGGARSIDVNMLLYQAEKMQHQFLDCMESLSRELTRLAEAHGLAPCEVVDKRVSQRAGKAREGLSSLVRSGTAASYGFPSPGGLCSSSLWRSGTVPSTDVPDSPRVISAASVQSWFRGLAAAALERPTSVH